MLWCRAMTYCLALALDEGLVFASDSRSNAGSDYVTTYGKTHVFTPNPDRLFVILTAGNLATTQEVINRLRRDATAPPVAHRPRPRAGRSGPAWPPSATCSRRPIWSAA